MPPDFVAGMYTVHAITLPLYVMGWRAAPSPGPIGRSGGCGISNSSPSMGIFIAAAPDLRPSIPPADAARFATVVALGASNAPLPGGKDFVRAVLVSRHSPLSPGADSAHACPVHFRELALRKPG